MTGPYPAVPDSALKQAYLKGIAVYGDVGLAFDNFVTLILPIIRKHLQSGTNHESVASLLERLHTSDLYLSIACAQQSEKAWAQFDSTFRVYITNLAALACPSRDVGQELSADIMSDMFLPNRAGQSRIASYDGQVSLRTWLRVIVMRRAINERERKCNSMECLDSISQISDHIGLQRLEADVRGHRYGEVIRGALKNAVESLSERERLLLVLHYEDSMTSVDIAHFIGVHPSTVSRQLQQVYVKLQAEVTSYLAVSCKLTLEQVEECKQDIVENPAHSVLTFVLAH